MSEFQETLDPLKPLQHYWGNTPEEEYYNQQGIKGTKSFFTSPRGLSLFTRSWQPLNINNNQPPRALIFMLHGYGNDISWTFQMTPIYLAQMGFACFAFDLEGHGQSQGLRAFVPNVDLVVEDFLAYFDSIRNGEEYKDLNLKCFLFGESMGGAICLLTHLKEKDLFQGAILVAPMCKISEKVRPRWPIPQVLGFFARFLPTLPIVPTADLLDRSVKVKSKRVIAVMNPMRYTGKPRLGTILEFLRVTDFLSQRLCEVRIPFIVVHGSDDVVTDPDVSRELYEEAKSEDKRIRIYDGMLHSMLFGETDENIEIVRKDILFWLEEKCSSSSSSSGS